MATITLTNETKQKLDNLMLETIKKEIKNPKIFIKALSRNKYGYTYNQFIDKLISAYKRK